MWSERRDKSLGIYTLGAEDRRVNLDNQLTDRSRGLAADERGCFSTSISTLTTCGNRPRSAQ